MRDIVFMNSFGEVYDHPHKGHDRLYLDKINSIYAVFDGAGAANLSQASIEQLPRAIAEQTEQMLSDQSKFVRVITFLDNLPEGRLAQSTAAIAQVKETKAGVVVDYFNAGDSSLYFYNQTEDTFNLLAHTSTQFVKKNGYTEISTEGFLGSERDVHTIASQIGTLLLPHKVEWTLVGITDGIMDDTGEGISAASLVKIMQYSKPANMPSEILKAVEKYDDAALFVISSIKQRKKKYNMKTNYRKLLGPIAVVVT